MALRKEGNVSCFLTTFMFQLFHLILLENNGKNLLIKYLYKDTMLLAVVIFMSTEGRGK